LAGSEVVSAQTTPLLELDALLELDEDDDAVPLAFDELVAPEPLASAELARPAPPEPPVPEPLAMRARVTASVQAKKTAGSIPSAKSGLQPA
jgi:hypothetical protein